MKILSYTQQSPIFLAYGCNILIQAHFSETLRKFNVNFIQALVAITLRFEGKGKTHPKSLAADLGVSKSTISQAVSNLESMGWIKRTVDPQDARSLTLVLTPEGKKHATQLISLFHGVERRFEQRLGKDKMRGLEYSLREILQEFSHQREG